MNLQLERLKGHGLLRIEACGRKALMFSVFGFAMLFCRIPPCKAQECCPEPDQYAAAQPEKVETSAANAKSNTISKCTPPHRRQQALPESRITATSNAARHRRKKLVIPTAGK